MRMYRVGSCNEQCILTRGKNVLSTVIAQYRSIPYQVEIMEEFTATEVCESVELAELLVTVVFASGPHAP